MWGPIIIGAILVALLAFIFTRSGTGVGKGSGGRSIKRGPGSHYNIDGVAKKTYQTLDDANLAAQRQGHREHAAFVAYRCRDCGKFHVGHAN